MARSPDARLTIGAISVPPRSSGVTGSHTWPATVKLGGRDGSLTGDIEGGLAEGVLIAHPTGSRANASSANHVLQLGAARPAIDEMLAAPAQLLLMVLYRHLWPDLCADRVPHVLS